MVKFKIKSTRGILTEKDVSDELKELGTKIKAVEKIRVLQKKFVVGRPTIRGRSKIKRLSTESKVLTLEAKKNLKIFELKGVKIRNKKVFVPAIRKGIKLRIRRRR